MEARAAPHVQNLLICWLLLLDSVLMMEGKVLSRETLWRLSVYYIAEIVWGLPQKLAVRRKRVLVCSNRTLRAEAVERVAITHLRKEKDISVK